MGIAPDSNSIDVGRVRLMPADLADQIAAGEVVERPASAVKELVENAIDAGATKVSVELEEGGLKLIRVSDDGVGMGRDDAELAVQRHATSKLMSRADLFNIQTLGFRGEALPSIASVSRFGLLTKPRGAVGGTRVTIEGGKLLEVTDAGSPPGTEVTVRDLFYNTPARLKFLKGRATELRHVVEGVERLAMANADISFALRHNGREIRDLPAVTTLSDRVFALFGSDDARRIFPIQPAEQDGVVCTGFFGEPALSKSTAASIWAYVNGRFVRDKSVLAAVRAGYQGMIDRGRHPVVVLFLTVPTGAVDVNVHPAKTEVRFHATDAVFRAVRRSIVNSLAEAPWISDQTRPSAVSRPRHSGDNPGASASTETQGALPVRSFELHVGSTFNRSRSSDSANVGVTDRAGEAWRAAPTSGERLDGPRWSSEASDVAARRDGSRGMAGVTDVEPWAAEWGAPEDRARSGPPPGYFEALHYIGAFRGTYLLASDGQTLVVVDQHAAHERITFEALRGAWKERRYHQQPLLVPQMLSLSATRAATLADSLEVFLRLGFEIEPFGSSEFALRATPVMLKSNRIAALIEDALDEIADTGHSVRIDDAIDAVLLRMACHGSVRAGDTLTIDEVYALFRQLDAVDFGANCPHGRPVYFKMSLGEIETRFSRR